MRRNIACFGLALLFATISGHAMAQDKVRIGLSSISATSGSLWVAEENGLFRKHGIDAELIVIGGGAARVVSSLISREIQFSVGGGDAVIRADLRGADEFYNRVPYALPKAVETTLEFIAGEEPKAKGADPKQFLDESLVREVEASGFIKALYDKEYR